MTTRTFCDRCDRDITGQDRLTVQLDRRIDDRPRFDHWDFCIQCARGLVVADLVDERAR
jgi:hypothetical protein